MDAADARPILSAMGWAGALSVLFVAAAIGVPDDMPQPSSHLALDTVVPIPVGENQVHWWRFDWRTVDLKPLENGASVRLFFYEKERETASIAAASIEETFQEYEKLFRFTPQKTTPIILYNSHFEFESSNAFSVSESLNGVTHKRTSAIALSYGADHQRFLEVLRHEIAHAFTLAKLKATSLAVGIVSPVSELPKWFVEGLAQEAALGELPPDALSALVDAVLEDTLPNILDRGGSTFESVYLLGHARVRFLEEVYGKGTWLALLDRVPSQTAKDKDSWKTLVTLATGTSREELEASWHAWAERRTRVFRSWEQPVTTLDGGDEDRIDELAISPDGRTLFYRSFDPDTGRSTLWLRDVDGTDARLRVTTDKRLGLESLHPFERGLVAIGEDVLVYAGRAGAQDRFFVRRWNRTRTDEGVKFEVGEERLRKLGGHLNFIDLRSPALSPDGFALAFVGLDGTSGRRDVWTFADPLGEGSELTRVTNDANSERDLAWGSEGLYWVNDATPDGHNELFLHAFEDGRTRRLTDLPAGGPSSPRALAGGRVLFTATATGVSQTYLRTSKSVVRLTRHPSGISQTVFDRSGRLVGVAGTRETGKLVAIEAAFLEPVAVEDWADAPPVAFRFPKKTLSDDQPYRPISIQNLSLTNIQLAASSGPFVEAQASFSDRMRDRVFLLGGRYAGSLDEKAARLMYLDRSRRLGWSAAAFFDNAIQIDSTYPSTTETYVLRRYGAQGQLYWPFGRYARVEAFLSPQSWGASNFSAPSGSFAQDNEGTSFAITTGVRFALDTLVYRPYVGPTRGTSGTFTFSGTGLSRISESFLTVGFDVQRYQPLFSSLPRIYLQGRVSAVLQPGGTLASQLFLPSAWNIRAYGGDDITVVARDYALATLELRLPLLPEKRGWPSLEAMLGADAGSLFFDFEDAWNNRVADVVFGLNLGLGFLTVRLHFARALDIGGIVLPPGLQMHISVWSPGPGL